MKKILLLLLCLVLLIFASYSVARMTPAMFGGGVGAAGGAPEYSFYFDFEDDVGSIVANEPSDLAGTNNNATREATPQAGTYSYLFNASQEYIAFSTSEDAVIDDALGWCTYYIYVNSLAAARYGNIIRESEGVEILIDYQTGGNVRIRYYDGSATAGVTSTDTIAIEGWYLIAVGWDAANDKVGIKIGAGSWATSTSTAFAPMGNATNLFVGSAGANLTDYYIDEMRCYKTTPGW